MQGKYEDYYLITSPNLKIQQIIQNNSDLINGTLFITENNDRVSADFKSKDDTFRCHLESETITVCEVTKKLIEIYDEKGSWVFCHFDE